jgi:FAD:protein FMN transferase
MKSAVLQSRAAPRSRATTGTSGRPACRVLSGGPGGMVTRSTSPVGISRFRVWGTSVTLAVQQADALQAAHALLSRAIGEFDRTCNRFRPDSEISLLNEAAGRARRVSPLFMNALRTAMSAAERTGGAVDPTVGEALRSLGYDRDYDEVAAGSPEQMIDTPPAAAQGWRTIVLDPSNRTALLPAGVRLDLGATAKALCADRAAATIARRIGTGVLVDLGGDLAMAGSAPGGGWQVAIVDNARTGEPTDDCVVTLRGGGLASSGTTVRAWTRSGRHLHHIIDPSTGWPAEPIWRMVTVAAGSAVDANTASTAAIVWGEDAPFRIAQLGLPARFVRLDGSTVEVGGWPTREGPR